MKNGGWRITGYDRDAAVSLVRGGLNPLVAVLLAARNLTDAAEINKIMTADASSITDPMMLADMDKAVSRIKSAVANGEHIAVYGDYDVDGITSVTMLSGYFRALGIECEAYVPDRLEGYGVNTAAIDLLREKGVTLIITVDCGITAVSEVEYARETGVEFIITDHHECAEEMPAAVAVVDPKRTDDSSGCDMLAGVGVAFKLVCALEGAEKTEALLRRFGDILALGTIADVMPVIGENRYYIRRGITLIGKSSHPGLRKLCEAAGLQNGVMNATQVGFVLAPRLNAAGRLGRTQCALDLLLTEDDATAASLAGELSELNRQRQALVEEMFENAVSLLRSKHEPKEPIVIAESGWNQGVAGIVASRLSEQFQLPAVVICIQDGIGRGSCRSVPGFNVYKALESAADVLERFGGHNVSAGLTVAEENIELLRSRLSEYYSKNGLDEEYPGLEVDFEVVKSGLLSVENINALTGLEPFGNGNPPPTLCIKRAEVTSLVPLSGGRHTKLWVQKFGDTFECIYFTKSPEELGVSVGDFADVAFLPQVNEFRGKRTVQLSLVDIRPA